MLSSPLAALVLLAVTAAAPDVAIRLESLEPTPRFVRANDGTLEQVARLKLDNAGPAVALRARIATAHGPARIESLGTVSPGPACLEIPVPDVARPTPLVVEALAGTSDQTLAALRVDWRPQRKHTLYCVFYSHGGVGFGNYPHRIRHDVRHATVQRALENCRLTDGRPADEQFRYVIESSESLTSFLNSYPGEAGELARRLRSGQIELSALHNVANSEQLAPECLARLFYLSGRHLRDLLDTPACRTALMNDLVGVTWPMVTFCQAADVPCLFHGYNRCAACMQPANAEPVFWWRAPGGNPARVLVRSCPYNLHVDRLAKVDEEEIDQAVALFTAQNWPLDTILIQNGGDYEFTTIEMLQRMDAWNRKWAYPRLVKATMAMFFQAAQAEMHARGIEPKTFSGDSNNQWADEDASHAWLLGLCRRLNEAVPTAEKYSTLAATLTEGGYPWTDIYQAYHRLMLYYEHGGGATMAGKGIHRAGAQHYETELGEHREVGTDAELFCNRALQSGLARLSAAIDADAPATLVVFNPLARPRTDSVRFSSPAISGPFRLVDSVTGREEPATPLDRGRWLFVARDVPALGYKTFRVEPAPSQPAPASPEVASLALENRFYRIRFDPATGAIASLFDKQLGLELVDQDAPHKMGEYVYEQFATHSFDVGPTWHRPRSARLSSRRGPVAQTMSAQIEAAGARRLNLSVTIYDDLPRVDFAMFLDKAPSGRRLANHGMGTALGKEGVYVALPLRVPQFRIRHELPGAVVEPIREQFAGSCTAFYTVQHFTDLSNDRFGVTVSSVEAPLVEYGHPRSCPMKLGVENEGEFESELVDPSKSHVYLYLMNNMFDTAVRIDQRGPHRFHWSLRSHAGDWRQGRADQFGWDVHNPLRARMIPAPQHGPLPAKSHSFLAVDQANVACTTIKPAEANGAGFIVRLVETQGLPTTARVSIPFCGPLDTVCETNLVEDDRPVALKTDAQGRIVVRMEPFGVKTLRVRCRGAAESAGVAGLRVRAVSDMEVALSWTAVSRAATSVSHYNVYRSDRPDFRPSFSGLVGRAPEAAWVDRPRLNFGGWLHNRLEPQTTYYYRVAAVDRWNNEGPASAAVKATTLSPSQKSAVPAEVVGLMAVHVSPLAPHNYVNLIFRTNCESDVVRYEVHRSTQRGFTPGEANRIGEVDPVAVIPGKKGYGNTPVDRRTGEFDHLMYQDFQTAPGTTYFYRVCAVDRVGQKGPFSAEASAATAPATTAAEVESCLFQLPDHGPEKAVDGDLRTGWISQPYGGGTPERPRWTALSVQFPRKTALAGLKIVGGPGGLPPEVYHWQQWDGSTWQRISDLRPAADGTAFVRLKRPVETEGIRVYVMAKELAESDDPRLNKTLRIAELLLLLPDGRETSVSALFGGPVASSGASPAPR